MRDSSLGLYGLAQTALSRGRVLPSLISPDQCIPLPLPPRWGQVHGLGYGLGDSLLPHSLNKNLLSVT